MSRILTGIQSTGTPHLGNILGAIKPAVELSKDQESSLNLQNFKESNKIHCLFVP